MMVSNQHLEYRQHHSNLSNSGSEILSSSVITDAFGVEGKDHHDYCMDRNAGNSHFSLTNRASVDQSPTALLSCTTGNSSSATEGITTTTLLQPIQRQPQPNRTHGPFQPVLGLRSVAASKTCFNADTSYQSIHNRSRNNTNDTSLLLSKSLGTSTASFAYRDRLTATSPNGKSSTHLSCHRHISSVSAISHSGYLLKRSNQPFVKNNCKEPLHYIHNRQQHYSETDDALFLTDEDNLSIIEDNHDTTSNSVLSVRPLSSDYDPDEFVLQTPTSSLHNHGTAVNTVESFRLLNNSNSFGNISVSLLGNDQFATHLHKEVVVNTTEASANVFASSTSLVELTHAGRKFYSSNNLNAIESNNSGSQPEGLSNESLQPCSRQDEAMLFIDSFFGLGSALLPHSCPSPSRTACDQVQEMSTNFVREPSSNMTIPVVTSTSSLSIQSKEKCVTTPESSYVSCHASEDENEIQVSPTLRRTNDTTYIRSVSDHDVSKQQMDFIDPTDGHIWRSKFCILEGECLFFYSHESIAHSPEAVLERKRWQFEGEEENFSQHQNEQTKLHTNHMLNRKLSPQQKNVSRSSLLSQSPMPRCNVIQIRAQADKNDQNRNEYGEPIHIGDSQLANHIYEKVVALECVGAVRSAELEYGPNSLELSGVAGGDNEDDKLVLRAISKEDMNEWLFQFQLSIATFVHDIMNQITTTMSAGDIHHRMFHHKSLIVPQLPSSLKISASSTVANDNCTSELPHYSSNTRVTLKDEHKTDVKNDCPNSKDRTSITDLESSSAIESPVQWPSLSVTTFSPRYHKVIYGSGSVSNSSSFALSHGHGRNSTYRRRGESNSSIASVETAPSIPMPSTLTSSRDTNSSTLTQTECANSSTTPTLNHFPLFGRDGTLPTVTPTPRNQDIRTEIDLSCSFQTPAPPSRSPICSMNQVNEQPISTEETHGLALAKSCSNSGKYLPPHLRNKSTTVSRSSTGSKYIPPHLRSNGIVSNKGANNNPIRQPGEKKIAETFQDGESSCDSQYVSRDVRKTSLPNTSFFDVEIGESDSILPKLPDSPIECLLKIGGCADPLHTIGSILDKQYIHRASKCSKISSKGQTVSHGQFSSHISQCNNNLTSKLGLEKESATEETVWKSPLQWEIGAVSDCGRRDTNQDSYVVTSNLLDVFSQLRKTDSDTSQSDSTLRWQGSTIWDQEGTLHPPGLLAIFDGHCGDQASRFAAELITSFIHNESNEAAKSNPRNPVSVTDEIERIMDRAIRNMDTAFCELCVEDERAWDSGSTALVAALANEHLVIANLGDSRGVMGRSVSVENAPSYIKDGWNELPEEENHDEKKKYLWKLVTTTHCPGLERERLRISKANGWVTTEKEIPVSQLKRMALFDDDVIDILKRCFSDRYSVCSNSSTREGQHSSPKTQKASAPQRILEISRVCGELAVSRALGDRDFKASFHKNKLLPSSTMQGSSNHNPSSFDELGTVSSDDIEWKSTVCLPYPAEHSGTFVGDLVSNVPEFQTLRIGQEDAEEEFLLLACDGLFDVMDPDDAYRVAHGLLFDKKWSAKKTAERLAQLAIHLGSSDNITVIVVRFFRASGFS